MRSMGSLCALLAGALLPGCAEKSPAELALHELTPPFAAVSGGAIVRLRGSGFVAGTQVLFGEERAAVQLDSAEQLSVRVPPWSRRQGPVTIQVVRPDGVLTQREDLFTYYALPGAAETRLLPPPEVRAMAVADWNRDGRPDLAVATLSPAAITLLLSQPGGGLLAAQRADGGSQPVAMAVAEANGNYGPSQIGR